MSRYEKTIRSLGLKEKGLTYERLFENAKALKGKGKEARRLLEILKAFDEGKEIKIDFPIDERGIALIPLEEATHWNIPSHAYYLLVKRLRRDFAPLSGLDPYALFRTKKRIDRDALFMYHSAICQFKETGAYSAINDSGIFDHDPDRLLDYRNGLTFRLYYQKGESLLDIEDKALRFALLLAVVYLLDDFGFSFRSRVKGGSK